MSSDLLETEVVDDSTLAPALAAAAASAAILAACGGGGGGSSSNGNSSSGGGSTTAMGQTAASRLLTQGTFGPTYSTVTAAGNQSYGQWFAEQAAATPSLTLAQVRSVANAQWIPLWWRNAILGADQLRQRMAFALSEIFVITDPDDGVQVAAYYDILVRNALGNYRKLLEEVTLSPAMGLFLNMFKNDKPDPATGRHADENYAREIMQLFSIGLVKLNVDGTVQTDAGGTPLPTYGQAEVMALARVFTGWGSHPDQHSGEDAWDYDQDVIDPMVAYENHHDTDAKTILGGVQVPAGGTAAGDLKIALDAIFNHPNVGPFIGKQIIQRLVTSNPSPAYVGRVAAAFNNNGSGVRGDLLAVARAVLTDPEAVTPGGTTYGKLREPLLRVTHLWRAFNAADSQGAFHEYSIVQAASYYFDQAPMQSPTVFNFFVPDYVRAGPLAQAHMVAPEFQITNEVSAIVTLNLIERQAYQFVDSVGTTHFDPYGYDETGELDADSVMLHTDEWESAAATPETLVDRLSLVFLQNAMPAAMRATLVAYVKGITASSTAFIAYRAIEAAALIINSPQYVVQR
ncbi:MAG TPA: DUF1800 domain-containing protein [Rhodocyclaceae bacterium]|nr:DUF1800 domain-containing protein [Rhodocyclaceae bacterium]